MLSRWTINSKGVPLINLDFLVMKLDAAMMELGCSLHMKKGNEIESHFLDISPQLCAQIRINFKYI